MQMHHIGEPGPTAELRSMLMIGVMPLPALMNSSLADSGSGSVKAPSTPPSRTITPGLAVRTKYGETLPDSTSFGVMLMKPSGRPGQKSSSTRANGGCRRRACRRASIDRAGGRATPSRAGSPP